MSHNQDLSYCNYQTYVPIKPTYVRHPNASILIKNELTTRKDFITLVILQVTE